MLSRCPLAVALVLAMAVPRAGAAPHGGKPSGEPREKVVLLDGRTYEGLIESQDEAWVHLIQIERQGPRTHLVIRPIERKQVASVAELDAARRAALRREIERFRGRTAVEAARMNSIRLGLADDGSHRFRYRGKWFSLESSLDEPTTRRVIVRAEQVFTAYRQVLPPRREAERPLQLVVAGTLGEYRDHLARLGIQIQNPACFVPADNLVLAGSDLNRVSAQLARLNAEHTQLQADLRRLEKDAACRMAELAKQMNRDGVPADQVAKTLGRQRAELDRLISAKRQEVQRANRQNEQQFQQVAGRMFAQLYHEAFHAYLENYVYPRAEYSVPLWLNEGLAQVFETASLEADTLVVDAPDAEFVRRLRRDLDSGRPMPLADVLAADQTAFLAGAEAARLYLHSWGLAYYLAFEKGMLGTPAIDAYVAKSNDGRPPVARFEKLVGMPLASFEAQWRAYIARLK